MLALLAPWLILALQEPAAREEQLLFFERQVRPLLENRCSECHGANLKKPKAGLRLDRPQNWLLGGADGPALVPGDPAMSLLVQRVRSSDEDERMPPKETLPEAEIALLVQWIQDGAVAPDEPAPEIEAVDWTAARSFWAFQPVADAPPPPVRMEEWCVNEVDRFVLARLEAAGLQPAPEASRPTLLRRASFILTGLPPQPEAISAFVKDTAPGAWDRAVERLLASPQYGEQWARHWLDLARYADSNGLDENLTYEHAWRYRDYVVRSFNQDKPYNRFVLEQIAGDLLPDPQDEAARADQLTGPSFLALGPKMLAEQDKEKLVFDTVDEQIDIWSRTFLGLTVSCARCHDHKFDPVPADDYYAVAGIFKSSQTFASLDFVSTWAVREIGSPEEVLRAKDYAERLQAVRSRVEIAEKESQETAERVLRDGTAGALLASQRLLAEAVPVEAVAASATSLGADRSQWGSDLDPIVYTIGGGEQFAEFRVNLPRAGRWRLEVRYASAEKRPVRVSWDGALLAEAALGEETGGFMLEHQVWSVAAEWPAEAGEHTLRLADAPNFPHVSRLLLVPADRAEADLALGALLAARDVRAYAAVSSRATAQDPLWAPWVAYLAGGAAALADLCAQMDGGSLTLGAEAAAIARAPSPATLEELAARYQVALSATKTLPIPLSSAERAELMAPAARAKLEEVRAELASLQGQAPPALPRVMTVLESDHPADQAVLHRGSHLTPRGPPVPRGPVRAAAFHCAMEPVPAGSSGRLQLAQWTADASNPLTARVMVNRIWQHQFGRGLVASPSNFGLRGEAPTDPALLDWLAARFIASGWSVKEMQRLLLQSSAWRMSSAWQVDAGAMDPSNLLLWRREPRRLDAEEVRDALLLASGRLDHALGGSLLLTKDREYVNNDQSANLVDYTIPRRSLYLPIVRNAIFDVFAIFDFNDPSVPLEARPRTTVAHQSLFAANAPLVRECAEALALRARASASASGGLALATAHPVDPALHAAFLLAWQREPAAADLERARAWLAAESAACGEDEAWIRFSHALLMSNPFYYLD